VDPETGPGHKIAAQRHLTELPASTRYNTMPCEVDARRSDAAARDSAAAGPEFMLVIPALNESATIRDVVCRGLQYARHIVVVDDGSTDGTAHVLEGLPIVVLRHGKTLGKAASLRHGMQCALEQGAAAIVTLDGDGQHAPEDIPRLIDAFRQTPGVIVIGARLHDSRRIPRARYFANRFANFWIAWAAGYPLHDSQSGFRLYPADVLRRLCVTHNRSHGFVFESEILIEAARAGIESVAVPIPAIYNPTARPSHFRPVLDIARITRMVAWKLLKRGMYLTGLARSLRSSRPACETHSFAAAGHKATVSRSYSNLKHRSVDYSEVNSAEHG
jgi:glycosyltransferase involved in cell wall biosynthesis